MGAFQGLSKEELMKYANDPFWVRLRWILFILFWFIWIAMLVASIVIIIYAPKCPSPEPKQWWQKNVMYKVSQDSGFESLNALKDNLDDLVETGVGTIFIPDLLESGTINTDWGTLEDFGDLVTALQQRDQKVVVGSLRPGDDARTWIESGVNGLVVDAGFTDDDLMKLRAVVDDMTENQGKSCIIISSDDLGENVHLTLSTNNNLAPSTAADLKTGLDMYMGQLSDEAWPSLGWVDKSWAKSLTDASMILKLLMPGTPVIEAGQELGGLNAWSKTTFYDQKNEPGSHWNVFSTLAHKMRHQDSILFGEFNSKTTFVDGDVFGMTRVKKGNPGYLLLVNFGAEPAVVNVANVTFIPDGIRLMTKSLVMQLMMKPPDLNQRKSQLEKKKQKCSPLFLNTNNNFRLQKHKSIF